MLKLKQLKQQQETQNKPSTEGPDNGENTAGGSTTENTETQGENDTGYVLKRQNSKELAEIRKKNQKKMSFP